MEQYIKILDLWRSYSIVSLADIDKYLASFRILFAYNSGKIENDEITYHDTREIFENGKVSGFTGIHEVGSAAEDVAADMTELIDEVNAYCGNDVLKASAYLHAKFEYIHPFADGNGRVGRTILNYYLMTRDYPPLIIYDEDKRAYYNALQKYDETEEIIPLVDFFRQQTEKTWAKALELAKKNSIF